MAVTKLEQHLTALNYFLPRNKRQMLAVLRWTITWQRTQVYQEGQRKCGEDDATDSDQIQVKQLAMQIFHISGGADDHLPGG